MPQNKRNAPLDAIKAKRGRLIVRQENSRKVINELEAVSKNTDIILYKLRKTVVTKTCLRI